MLTDVATILKVILRLLELWTKKYFSALLLSSRLIGVMVRCSAIEFIGCWVNFIGDFLICGLFRVLLTSVVCLSLLQKGLCFSMSLKNG